MKRTTKEVKMTNTNKPAKPLTEQEKQFLPMPGETNPSEVRTKAFLAIQKAKTKITNRNK